MAATLTSTGTWSVIASAARPVTHRDTVERRMESGSLDFNGTYGGDVNGWPEFEQMIGLVASAYSISNMAARALIRDWANASEQGQSLGTVREYTTGDA